MCDTMNPLYGAYLCRMCQCRLHAVLWSHIGILMRLLAAEPRSTAGPLSCSQCHCGTILLTLYSMVWDCRLSKAGPIPFYWPKLLYPCFWRCFWCFVLPVLEYCSAVWCSAADTHLGIISRIRNTLNIEYKKMIYYSLIHPYLTSCINVWSSMTLYICGSVVYAVQEKV